MLVEYVTDKNGHRVGVVVAISKDRIGWSRCKTKPSADPFADHPGFDSFDKQRALLIAHGRATCERPVKTIPPADVQKVIGHMQARAKAYFKEETPSQYYINANDVPDRSLWDEPRVVPSNMKDILALARKAANPY